MWNDDDESISFTLDELEIKNIMHALKSFVIIKKEEIVDPRFDFDE